MSINISVSSFNLGDTVRVEDRYYWVRAVHKEDIFNGLVLSEFTPDGKTVFLAEGVDVDVEKVIATPQQMEFICNQIQSSRTGVSYEDLSKAVAIAHRIYSHWCSKTDADFTLCDTLMERLQTGNIIHLESETATGYFVVVSTPYDPFECRWATYHLLSIENGQIDRDSKPVRYFPDGEDKIQSAIIPGNNVLDYFLAMLYTCQDEYKMHLQYKMPACAENSAALVKFYTKVVNRIKRDQSK